MYSSLTSFFLGFHGCDREVGERILAGKGRLHASHNSYDWLGHGMYFWENDPVRAMNFAKHLSRRSQQHKIAEPFVLGAILDLGHCLNLVQSENLHLLQDAYMLLNLSAVESNSSLPLNKRAGDEEDLLLRHLDCAVIETLHSHLAENQRKSFDSVRGVFWEGKELYPGAGFCEKNHIQICIRNPNCIKGYFRPLQPIEDFDLP